MSNGSDIFRAARYLISVYGASALRTAEKRAHDIAPRTDGAAASAWPQITDAVRELQNSGGPGRN